MEIFSAYFIMAVGQILNQWKLYNLISIQFIIVSTNKIIIFYKKLYSIHELKNYTLNYCERIHHIITV